jgi:hypothetical protein
MSADYDDVDDLPEYDLTENEALSERLEVLEQTRGENLRLWASRPLELERLDAEIKSIRDQLGRDE